MRVVWLARRMRGIGRRWRQARLFARAMTEPRIPVVAHLIPTRRCNLACAYCNEYDAVSEPVPPAEIAGRIERLAELGCSAVTLSGGEPLLHPHVEDIVRRIRRRRMLAGLITNGYLLSPSLIDRLNRAGLDHLQISIDNAEPDQVSKKSLRVLDSKLVWLARRAAFEVNINVVIGTRVARPEEAVGIFRRAAALGFHTTIGLVHDGRGQMVPLSAAERAVYQELVRISRASFADFAAYRQFQWNLIEGRANQWHCRAGCRYLYVCERGLVHYCSQQRGRPGIPLESYTRADLEREYSSSKPCAPYCTISCVHQTSMLDQLREQPLEALARWFPSPASGGEAALPTGVRVLKWLFLPARLGGRRPRLTRLLTRAALRVLGLR